jgi:non-canonical (house-cleaning) NTP pyrophosphatase
MSQQKNTNPLISNVAPPTELPTFIVQQTKKEDTKDEVAGGSKFSAAIPPEKNVTAESPKEVTPSEHDELPALPVDEIKAALSPLTEGVKNSVLFGWMKDSIKSSSEVLQSGLQKMVVTLDPQMSSILYSGGDVEVVVASANEDKIDPVRQSFQQVFKKATVYGIASQAKTIAAQPVGFESAELSAKERVNYLRSNEAYVDKVIVSIENFLVEVYKGQWFDVGLLLLSDPRRNISLKTFTQMTSIPSTVIQVIETDTPKDYERRATGFSIPVGKVMSQNLGVPHYEWHKAYTSIDRFEIILNASRALATIYKSELQLKATAASSSEETKN